MRRLMVHGFLGFVWVCLAASGAAQAQDSLQAAGASVSAAPSTPVQDTSKKVWTNEDVAGLHDNTAVSTSRATKPKTSAGYTRSANPSGRNAGWYRNQIAKLQEQVPPLNDQIAALQAALDGKATGDQKESTRPYNTGVRIDTWAGERDRLTKKRDGILAQIDTLRDEARHNGVPDSALP